MSLQKRDKKKAMNNLQNAVQVFVIGWFWREIGCTTNKLKQKSNPKIHNFFSEMKKCIYQNPTKKYT